MNARTFLQQIWYDVKIGQNIDVYVTIILSTFIAVLSVFNVVSLPIVLAAVLTTLSLVSTGLLINRHSHEYILQNLAKLDSIGIANRFFQEDYDGAELSQLILSSNQAFLWGFAFTATVPMLRNQLERGLANGLKVRFLLIKPYSKAAEMAAFGSNTQDEEEFNKMILNSLDMLASVQKRASSGSLEIKVIDYLPPFTAVAVEPYSSDGHMRIRVASFRMEKHRVPWFELSADADSKWFNIFVNQFETIWERAEPWNLH